MALWCLQQPFLLQNDNPVQHVLSFHDELDGSNGKSSFVFTMENGAT